MSTEMITCAMCGTTMPAGVRFCPECGSVNSKAADAGNITDMALPTDSPQDSPAESRSAASGPLASATGNNIPLYGSPTINVGSSDTGSGTNYFQPQATPPGQWQPGQYGAGPHAADQTQTRDLGQNQPLPLPSYSYSIPVPQSQPGQQGQGYTPPTYVLPQYSPQTQSFQPGGMQQIQPMQQQPVQGYPGYQQPPANYQYPPQIGYATRPPRDSTVALLLELIGYLGFLGIGHIYGGRTARGVALLLGFWAYIFISTLLTIFLVGCLMLLIVPAVPILSGLWIKNDLDKEQSMMRRGY